MEEKQIDDILCLVGYYNEKEGQYIQPKICKKEQVENIIKEAIARRNRDIKTLMGLEEDQYITKKYKEETKEYIQSLKIIAVEIEIRKIIKIKE